MGQKGISKGKLEKSRPFSNADIGGSSNVRSSERSLVQSLVKDKGAPLHGDGMKPPAGNGKSIKLVRDE